MSFIVSGQVSTFWLQLLFCVVVLWFTNRARKGMPMPEIRRVAGLDAIDEAIGRATEMGRPVVYVPGIGDLGEAQTLASLAILGHVASVTARYDTRILVANRNTVVHPITEAIVQQSYREAGKLERFNPDDIRFMSSEQFAFASGVMGMMAREQAAAAILIGAFWSESLLFAEKGHQLGAIQVAGTANVHQLPFFVTACDYTLIGEEMYAASAYLTRQPVLLANIVAQDYGKLSAIIVILAGAIITTFGGKSYLSFLSK